MEGTGNRERTIIKAFLISQIKEYLLGEERIFKKLNLQYNAKKDIMLLDIAKRASIYYLEFLGRRINLDRLEKFLKREVRIVLAQVREKTFADELSAPDPEKAKERLQNQIDFLFNFTRPILLPFQNPEELMNILNSAQQLADEQQLHPVAIFIRHRDSLWRRLYKTPENLKRALANLFVNFTAKEIMKRVADLDGERVSDLNNALASIIENRAKEIFPTCN